MMVPNALGGVGLQEEEERRATAEAAGRQRAVQLVGVGKLPGRDRSMEWNRPTGLDLLTYASTAKWLSTVRLGEQATPTAVRVFWTRYRASGRWQRGDGYSGVAHSFAVKHRAEVRREAGKGIRDYRKIDAESP